MRREEQTSAGLGPTARNKVPRMDSWLRQLEPAPRVSHTGAGYKLTSPFGENLDGGRGERDLAMEQSRPRVLAGLKGPGPHEPYPPTAVPVGHVRAIQAPSGERGTEANKSSLDCNAQRTLNARSTYAQRTLNVTRNMLSGTVFQERKAFKEFSFIEETFEHASIRETRHC